MKLYSIAAIRHSKDFYSAVIRCSLGLFIALYVWVGMSNGDFLLSQFEYNSFASFFFIITFILAADIFRNPNCQMRRYITLLFDISCTSYMITLTGGGSSHFLLIYIWLYIAYGTRYGATYLYTAVALVILQYNIILLIDGRWLSHTLGSSAQLFVLITMPLYLHSMLKQLRDAKIAAEAATRAKSNFLATMSHEIRTPMSGIIGMAHLLQATSPNKQQREYIKALLDASKSLHALIDDILDFSKIEANKLHLQNSPFNLQQTINEVITVLSPNAECHSLDLIVSIDPELPASVLGDAQRIKQIVFNLLGNAIKFTETGEIVLTISEVKTEAKLAESPGSTERIILRFDLIDTGIGISKQQQDHIFDSFTQAEELQIHKFGGTGLGTTISKQLVECMGGKIGLSSVLGSGSHFWFTLPLPIVKNCQYREVYKLLFIDKKVAMLIHNKALYKTLAHYCRFFGFTINGFATEIELVDALQQAVKQKQPFDLLIVSSERDQALPFKLVDTINTLDYGSYSVPKKIFLNYLNKDPDNKQSAHSLFDCCISKPVYFEQLADELLQLLVPETVSAYKTKCSAENTISLHFLIAEDEDINAMVLGSFLRDAGHSSERVKDGAQAVAELAKNKYDIAFMDMHMPVMDGIDATRTWREREPKESHIPIIALTANATKDDRQACLQAGMDDFMTKPITPERLSSAIIKFSSYKT